MTRSITADILLAGAAGAALLTLAASYRGWWLLAVPSAAGTVIGVLASRWAREAVGR